MLHVFEHSNNPDYNIQTTFDTKYHEHPNNPKQSNPNNSNNPKTNFKH